MYPLILYYCMYILISTIVVIVYVYGIFTTIIIMCFLLLLVYGSDFSKNFFIYVYALFLCYLRCCGVWYSYPLNIFLKNFSLGDMVRLYNLSVIHWLQWKIFMQCICWCCLNPREVFFSFELLVYVAVDNAVIILIELVNNLYS